RARASFLGDNLHFEKIRCLKSQWSRCNRFGWRPHSNPARSRISGGAGFRDLGYVNFHLASQFDACFSHKPLRQQSLIEVSGDGFGPSAMKTVPMTLLTQRRAKMIEQRHGGSLQKWRTFVDHSQWIELTRLVPRPRTRT